jgi:hypothetical protein
MRRLLVSALVASVVPVAVVNSQTGVGGAWYGTIDQWTADTPMRDLVVEPNGTCRWGLGQRPNGPGSAKSCSVNAAAGTIQLVTGADSNVTLILKGAYLEGTFQLKNGEAHKIRFARDTYPAASASAAPVTSPPARTAIRLAPGEKVRIGYIYQVTDPPECKSVLKRAVSVEPVGDSARGIELSLEPGVQVTPRGCPGKTVPGAYILARQMAAVSAEESRTLRFSTTLEQYDTGRYVDRFTMTVVLTPAGPARTPY